MSTLTQNPPLCGFCAAPLAPGGQPEKHLVFHADNAPTMGSDEAMGFYILPDDKQYPDAYEAFLAKKKR